MLRGTDHEDCALTPSQDLQRCNGKLINLSKQCHKQPKSRHKINKDACTSSTKTHKINKDTMATIFGFGGHATTFDESSNFAPPRGIAKRPLGEIQNIRNPPRRVGPVGRSAFGDPGSVGGLTYLLSASA